MGEDGNDRPAEVAPQARVPSLCGRGVGPSPSARGGCLHDCRSPTCRARQQNRLERFVELVARFPSVRYLARMSINDPGFTSPGGAPPTNILLALGELASIQIELLKLMERAVRPGPAIPVNRLFQPGYLEDRSPPAYNEINALRLRAQVVLKWIAEKTAA